LWHSIPQLYRSGQKGELFNVKVFLVWMASSVWQSLVCFYVPVWSMAVVAIDSQGHTAGQWAVGTVACCVVIITVNLRLLLECSYHTWITYVSVIGSIFMWFAYVAIYCSIWSAPQPIMP
jgi:magnesium-transporting ATPase (P-type)